MNIIILLTLLVFCVIFNIRDLSHKTIDYSGYTNESFIKTYKNISSAKTWIFFGLHFFAIVSLIPSVWATLLVNDYIATIGCVLNIVFNLVTYNWLCGMIYKIIDKEIDNQLKKPFWYFGTLMYYLIFDSYLIYMIMIKIILKI